MLQYPAGVTGGSAQYPAGVTGGSAQKSTDKAQDRCDLRGTAAAACFGVYDGHGGLAAALACEDRLGPALLELAPIFPTADVEKRFWRIDSELGSAGVTAGTTASVLLVARRGPLPLDLTSTSDSGSDGGTAALPETDDSVHSTASMVEAVSASGYVAL